MKGCGRTIAGLACCTVIHGDCDEYLRQFSPGDVDLVVTDPPYGMNLKMWRKEHRPIHGDDRFPVETIKRLTKIPRLGAYFFCRWDNLWEHDGTLPKPKSVVVWKKSAGSGSGDCKHEHSRAYEMVMFYPGPEHKFITRPDDVLPAACARNELHPTQKPVELIMEILAWYNFKTVLDPYMGCGSTGRAAKRLGKHFLGFEIDEKHYATAVRSIERPLPFKKHVMKIQEQPRLFDNQE